MISENLKENDILVSTLYNPDSNINDLIQAGLNANNTQLLTPDVYKSSDFIKNNFSDKNGKFNEELFNQAYTLASKKYSDLVFKDTAKQIKELIDYNQNDLYAPQGAKYQEPEYSISRISNPFNQITGIASIYGTEESNKSVRELAQKGKIYDTKTGKYLDKSAEDLGLFGGLFSAPLVYAKWHEDGEHIDPITGRTVKHKKGDYRLNEDGQFFTETIGKKEGYNEEFVALSDILTKEDSWLNKIDVFDSDDKEKSAIGTVMKTAVAIVPYLIPGVNSVWGGITAAIAMGSVLPTFAKALEGLVVGDKNTGFTDSMSVLENYFRRFDSSMSDEGQQKSFGLESIGQTVADVFGQLFQMRAAASLSKLTRLDWDSANAKAFASFKQKHSAELSNLILQGKVKPTKEGIQSFWKDIAAQTPELKELISKQSKLSRNLSLGYMALLTSADVYKEALEGGYSRRVAGAAALTSTLTQYLMMNTLDDKISSWFLDELVGYNEFAANKATRESLKTLWDRIEGSVNTLSGLSKEAQQKEFANIFSKAFNGTKNLYYKLLDGTSEFWTRSLAESIEEISEEAMMDLTKGAFDALSSFGFLGEKNKAASFNTIDNTFSKKGLLRYAQNAFGGFLGGGLFHLQDRYINPLFRGQKIPKGTELDLIKGIQNGEAEQYKELARQLGKRDNFVSPIPFNQNEELIEVSAGNEKTRGEVIADKVIQHIEYLQGLLGQYDANISGDELLSKVIRDYGVLQAIKESDINNLILDDFDNTIADLVQVRQELDTQLQEENPSETQKATIKKNEAKKKELEQKIESYLNGEQEEYYMKAALAYLNPAIRDNLSNISIYQFAKVVTGKEWNDIENKEEIKSQYADWQAMSDKKQQIKRLVDTMDLLSPSFSPKFKEYSKRYLDVRRKTFENILSQTNWNFADILDQESGMYNVLLKLSEATQKSGLQGATLEDMLQVNPEEIIEPIIRQIYEEDEDRKQMFNIIAKQIASNDETLKTASDKEQIDSYLKTLSKSIATQISNYPIEQWDYNRLNTLLKDQFNTIADSVQKEADSEKDSTRKEELNLFVNQLRSFETNIEFKNNLAKQAIKTYLSKQESIDGELLKRIKKTIIDEIANYEFLLPLTGKISGWTYELNNGQGFYLSKDAIRKITNQLREELENGETNIKPKLAEFMEQEILAKEGNNVISQEDLNELKEVIQDSINFIFKDNEQDKDLEFLKDISVKETADNPLYDLLRELSFQLAPEVNTTIFDLLKNESDNLSGLYDISEYIKMPDIIEQIKNARAILEISKAILVGMEDSINAPGTLFSYNSQVKKYLEKFKNGENADKYETLSSQEIYTISADIDLLINKLDFIERLSSMNTESQVQEDKITRDKFNSLIIKKLQDNAAALQIKGVSILTPDDLALLENSEDPEYIRVAKVQHNMFEQFKKVLETLEETEKQNVIDSIFDALNLDIEKVVLSALDTSRLNKNITTLTDYDWIVWLATTLGTDANEYYIRYKNYLEAHKDEEMVPLFIQELNTQIAYSALVDSTNAHNYIQNYIIRHGNGAPANINTITFIDGVSGSGKTTAIAKVLIAFNPDLTIWATAPNIGQANKLSKSLGIEIPTGNVSDKQGILNKFIKPETLANLESLIKEIPVSKGTYLGLSETITLDSDIFNTLVDIPNILVIDEVTHFNTAELQLLDLAAKHFGFKIITLGDTYQESALLKAPDSVSFSEAHIDNVFAWKGPRLGISSRPANVNKKDNIDRFQVALDIYYNTYKQTNDSSKASDALDAYIKSTGLTIKYYDDITLQGDKVVGQIEQIESYIDKILSSLESDEKIMIISPLDDNGQLINTKLKSILESKKVIDKCVFKSPEKIHPNAVQGEESKYCIVDMSKISALSNVEIIKKLYTLLTRSQEGSVVVLPQDIQNNLNIHNTKSTKPSIYKLPGLQKNAEIKTNRISDIDKILNGWESSSVVVPETKESEESMTKKEVTLPSEPVELPIPPTTVTIEPEKESDIYGYGFYNHIGASFNGDTYESGKRDINLDLEGLNLKFTEDEVRGFIKLRNAILYTNGDVTKLKKLLNDSDYNKDIISFLKKITNQNRNNKDFIDQFIRNLHIESDSLVGILTDSNLDAPLYKFGFDPKEIISGNILLLRARKVKFTIGDYTFDRYITLGCMPKSSTMRKATKLSTSIELANLVETLEIDAKSKLNTQSLVVYPNIEFKQVGDHFGRFEKTSNPDSFISLQQLIDSGVVIKEIKLITAAVDASGKNKFIQYAQQYNPVIDKVAFDEKGNFLLSGRYMVRVSFVNTTIKGDKETDYIFIVDPKKVEQENILNILSEFKEDKTSKGRNKLLTLFSYKSLLLRILQDPNTGFINKSDVSKLVQFLGGKNGNEGIIEYLKSLRNNYSGIIQNIEKFLQNPNTSTINTLLSDRNTLYILLDRIIGDINDDGSIEIHLGGGKSVNIDPKKLGLTLYYNVAPEDIVDKNGTCKVDYKGNEWKLGMTTGYYELPRFSVTKENIENILKSPEVSIPSTPVVTPKPIIALVTPKIITKKEKEFQLDNILSESMLDDLDANGIKDEVENQIKQALEGLDITEEQLIEILEESFIKDGKLMLYDSVISDDDTIKQFINKINGNVNNC